MYQKVSLDSQKEVANRVRNPQHCTLSQIFYVAFNTQYIFYDCVGISTFALVEIASSLFQKLVTVFCCV